MAQVLPMGMLTRKKISLFLLAGGGSGTLKTGHYLAPRRATSMSKLHLAMLQRMGVPCDRFGEAEIALEGIS